MRKSSLLILKIFLLGIFLPFFLTSTTYANIGCGGWTLGFGCPNAGQIEYCKSGSNCSLSGGLTATRTAVGNLFTEKTISNYASDVVRYFMTFVTIIGVIYVLYAGFQLMTGGGDEEKVKNARKIIIFVAAGIVLMWLAYWIVLLILESVV